MQQSNLFYRHLCLWRRVLFKLNLVVMMLNDWRVTAHVQDCISTLFDKKRPNANSWWYGKADDM